ncbi:MAG: hypothetical protein EAZ85_12615 [Bacteroidetes bacterium]|nr:MAG: hypothetical protein EAZ85_12615 [Bacteroidota bacterium]TAG87169.1 MAG: hypothetical protein EAZ20_11170 [Bacteroidota bacterium]
MKKIIYGVLFLASFALFSSTKKPLTSISLEELREKLWLQNTCTWYESEEKNGKQEIIFDLVDKMNYSYKNTPANQCKTITSVAFRYMYSMATITESETWYNPKTYFSDGSFSQKFKEIFGVDPIDKVIVDANGSKDKGFRFFNNKAIETIFNKLYVKPTTELQGVAYQKIYDISLKEYMADMTDVIASILKDKKQFQKIAKEYLERVKKDKKFNGIDATNKYREKYFSQLFFKCKNYNGADAINRLLGIMLRRESDGTLKVMLNSLKTVLNDYDKQTFEKYKNIF